MERPAVLLNSEELKAIWKEYVNGGDLDPRLPEYVADGWRRCRASGLDPYKSGSGTFVGEALFRSILSENHTLIEAALPIMHRVRSIMERSHSIMALTDSTGCILEVVGNASDVDAVYRKANYYPGVKWDNLSVGTNGISAALDHDRTVQLRGAEHWPVSHQVGVCSAVPIHDPDGILIGCLNLSEEGFLDDEEVNLLSLGMVQAAVEGIEGKLRTHRSMEMLRVALENVADSIFMIDSDLHPVWMNRSARQLMGISGEAAKELNFKEILPEVPWLTDPAEIENSKGRFQADDLRAILPDRQIRCGVEIYPLIDFEKRIFNVILRQQKHLIIAANRLLGNRASQKFNDMYTQDPGMKRVLDLARKYAMYEGDILIEGEPGTGKEMLAQSIHNQSRRREGPFVTVNCELLQWDRIRKELFGYEASEEDGEGNPGRFELADGGTILLSGIEDLPLDIRKALDNVFETHCIRRVGGGETRLDIRIICTLNTLTENGRNTAGKLPVALANTLTLSIPPLRERKGDIELCAVDVLDRLNYLDPGPDKSMSPEFVNELMKRSWPGNVNELQDEIERIFYLSPGRTLDISLLQPASEILSEEEPLSDQDMEEAEHLQAVLRECRGNVDEAAERLGLSRATLYRRLKKYGIRASRMKYI